MTLEAATAIRTILMVDLVDSTRLVAALGDARGAELFARVDRLSRDAVARHAGREIDRTDGFLLLFERPIDAAACALEIHAALRALSRAEGVELRARAAAHLGEVVLRENAPGDVARGAKPLEVEGLAKPQAARIMSLALGGQTLLTRAAFDLARRAAAGNDRLPPGVLWLAHGAYHVKGIDDGAVEVFEVGIEGEAPLAPPPDTEKARRASAPGEVAGWRPAAGAAVPGRGDWTLERKLGEGGFGEVWLGASAKYREQRVFKFCLDPARLMGLRREVALFAVLRDVAAKRNDLARIVSWQLDEAPYFVELEYTEGGNLAEWADAKGGLSRVPLKQRVELVAQVADALDAAHRLGVLHKDIKPANILVWEDADGNPRIRLTDFGIGALADGAAGTTAELSKTVIQELTENRTVSGSAMYTAPEVLEGKPATIQSDIYALGVLLYQMFVGDLRRAAGLGWERDVPVPKGGSWLKWIALSLVDLHEWYWGWKSTAAHHVFRTDIRAMVEQSPDRRPASCREVGKRLRAMHARRRSYYVKLMAASGVFSFVFGIFPMTAVRGFEYTRAYTVLSSEADGAPEWARFAPPVDALLRERPPLAESDLVPFRRSVEEVAWEVARRARVEAEFRSAIPMNPELELRRGALFFQAGRLRDARGRFEAASSSGAETEAVVGLAACMAEGGGSEEGWRLLEEEAFRLRGGDAFEPERLLWLLRARRDYAARWLLERFTEADREFNDAIEDYRDDRSGEWKDLRRRDSSGAFGS
ncbi:MAG: protein kinase [Candidatus Sumerlaeia bacterium]|nr:protein kinase [Candidatus Sumerlaeia bacterium]